MPPRKRRYRITFLCLVGISVILFSLQIVEGADGFQTTPTTRSGKKWIIGYYEGGPYANYPANLKAIADGLTRLGWMEKTTFADTEDTTDAYGVWTALSNAKSEYIQFDRQAYYSAYWDDPIRASNKNIALSSLQNEQLDLIIAMGTWAGQDLANDQHSVPVMVVSSSDPVKSGIVKSPYYSGLDNVHAKCDPNRYIRQLRLFHNIVGFKRLGVAYEDTLEGRSYAAIEDIEYVSARHKFEIVKCDAPWTGLTKQEYVRNLVECHKKIAPQVDAVYLTVHAGMDSQQMEKILAPLVKHKIPTWSQRGPQHVKNGALMSITRSGFGPIGRYHAGIMAKIFNGANPSKLNQIFEDPRNIAINLRTAKSIGFRPPKGLMMVADEVYE